MQSMIEKTLANATKNLRLRLVILSLTRALLFLDNKTDYSLVCLLCWQEIILSGVAAYSVQSTYFLFMDLYQFVVI
jgi:hypothetical protein